MTSEDRPSSTATGTYRRDVMRAVGAGAAVGMVGGVASADEHGEEPMYEEPLDADDEHDVPTDGRVHVVTTHVAPSTHPERPADFFYEPTGLHVDPDDVVKFVFVTPDHTVTSYHPAFGMQRRLPAGVEPFSSPVLGWDPRSLPDDVDMPPAEDGEADGPRPSTWLHAFETPGVHDLECAPHEVFGMAMRVVVGDETETAFETEDPAALPEPRVGPVGLAGEVLTDPALDPKSIVDAGSVEWMDLETNDGDGVENGDDEE